MTLEIERKFLCTLTREEAEKLSYLSRQVKSIYLTNTPTKSVRVVKDTYLDGYIECKWTEKYTKESSTLVREEKEDYLPPVVFDSLDNGKYPSISKHRCLIGINGFTWEIDFFDGYDFVIAELEFINEEEANSFTDFPEWISIEVTQDPSYLNCNLAL